MKSALVYSGVILLVLIIWLAYGYATLADNVRAHALAAVSQSNPAQSLEVTDTNIYPDTWSVLVEGDGNAYFVRGVHRSVLGITLPPPFRGTAVTDVAIDE